MHKRVTFAPDVADPPPTLKCNSCKYRQFKAFALKISACVACNKTFCSYCMTNASSCNACRLSKHKLRSTSRNKPND